MQDSDNLWRHEFWSNKFIASKMEQFYGAIIWYHLMAPFYGMCACFIVSNVWCAMLFFLSLLSLYDLSRADWRLASSPCMYLIVTLFLQSQTAADCVNVCLWWTDEQLRRGTVASGVGRRNRVTESRFSGRGEIRSASSTESSLIVRSNVVVFELCCVKYLFCF